MKVLATAYSAKEKHGSGNHVPMLIAIRYGLGRVFHTPMGHDDRAMQCAGFATALTRGAEWAATGKVTIPIPGDFPTPTAQRVVTTKASWRETILLAAIRSRLSVADADDSGACRVFHRNCRHRSPQRPRRLLPGTVAAIAWPTVSSLTPSMTISRAQRASSMSAVCVRPRSVGQ